MKRTATALLGPTAIGCVLVVSGCIADTTVKVNYSGTFQQVVSACAELASAGRYRDDPSMPAAVTVEIDTAEQTVAGPNIDIFEYEVAGSTLVEGDGTARYDWRCHVAVDYVESSLQARLTRST